MGLRHEEGGTASPGMREVGCGGERTSFASLLTVTPAPGTVLHVGGVNRHSFAE